MKDLVVVGIDPGLAATGYGIVARAGRSIKCLGFGSITTSAKEDIPIRLGRIYHEVSGIIEGCSPQLVVIEDVFIKNAAPSAALSIGQVRGVLLLAASEHGCAVLDIAPRAVKMAIAGNGAADKYQVERGLRRFLGLVDQIQPDHAADALGLAYVGALRQ